MRIRVVSYTWRARVCTTCDVPVWTQYGVCGCTLRRVWCAATGLQCHGADTCRGTCKNALCFFCIEATRVTGCYSRQVRIEVADAPTAHMARVFVGGFGLPLASK